MTNRHGKAMLLLIRAKYGVLPALRLLWFAFSPVFTFTSSPVSQRNANKPMRDSASMLTMHLWLPNMTAWVSPIVNMLDSDWASKILLRCEFDDVSFTSLKPQALCLVNKKCFEFQTADMVSVWEHSYLKMTGFSCHCMDQLQTLTTNSNMAYKHWRFYEQYLYTIRLSWMHLFLDKVIHL